MTDEQIADALVEAGVLSKFHTLGDEPRTIYSIVGLNHIPMGGDLIFDTGDLAFAAWAKVQERWPGAGYEYFDGEYVVYIHDADHREYVAKGTDARAMTEACVKALQSV